MNRRKTLNSETICLLKSLNVAFNRVRGAYALWAKENQVSYHEMVILYTLQEGSCHTQGQICEQYLLPKQTINNVISSLQVRGYVSLLADMPDRREKRLELTASGRQYTNQLLRPLRCIEEQLLLQLNAKELQHMADMVLCYGQILENLIHDDRQEEPS